MQTKLRTGILGDIFVLVEPAQSETAVLHQKQKFLQSVFGGQLHKRIHLTCQRFELPDDRYLNEVIQQLKAKMERIQPFQLISDSLVHIYAPFWQSHLLRWQIQETEDILYLGELIEDGLRAAGIMPHFPQTSSRKPTLVTALEEVSRTAFEQHLDEIAFPQYLFTARHIVLSKIVGQAEFKILKAIPLSDM